MSAISPSPSSDSTRLALRFAMMPRAAKGGKRQKRPHADTTVNLPDDFEGNLKALLAPPHDITGSRKKKPRGGWGGARKKGHTVTGREKR